MKNFLIKLLIIIICAIAIALSFGRLTDRICEKPYSPEFKQTQTYKDMQCPNLDSQLVQTNGQQSTR